MMSSIKRIDNIWFRNSLALGYWTFGKSDIDITVCVTNLDEELGKKIIRNHAQIKSFLKVIGELVIIDQATRALDTLKEIINTCELMRDPELCKLIPPPHPTENEKIIFLHKFIINNWEHNKKDKISKRKLRFCFDFLTIPSSDYTFSSLCTHLSSLMQNDSFDSNVELIYDQISRNIPVSNKRIPCNYYALFFNKLYYSNILPDLPYSSQSKDLLALTIKWEEWASFTNKYDSNLFNFEIHVQNLKLVARKLGLT